MVYKNTQFYTFYSMKRGLSSGNFTVKTLFFLQKSAAVQYQ